MRERKNCWMQPDREDKKKKKLSMKRKRKGGRKREKSMKKKGRNDTNRDRSWLKLTSRKRQANLSRMSRKRLQSQ